MMVFLTERRLRDIIREEMLMDLDTTTKIGFNGYELVKTESKSVKWIVYNILHHLNLVYQPGTRTYDVLVERPPEEDKS